MLEFSEQQHRPQLLVSVRNADEALAALEGGAHVIDVKEPDRGSLGAADASAIAEIVLAVNGRAPVTAAGGELVELLDREPRELRAMFPAGVSLVKVGLAGSREIADWSAQWRETFGAMIDHNLQIACRPVAVVYADWRAANAPDPDDVLDAAVNFGCPALLVDTWDKTNGGLFDHWTVEETGDFVRKVRSHRMIAVLAGSLTSDSMNLAIRLQPNLVAVRGAACKSGRRGTISRQRVHDLRQAIDALPMFAKPLFTT